MSKREEIYKDIVLKILYEYAIDEECFAEEDPNTTRIIYYSTNTMERYACTYASWEELFNHELKDMLLEFEPEEDELEDGFDSDLKELSKLDEDVKEYLEEIGENNNLSG